MKLQSHEILTKGNPDRDKNKKIKLITAKKAKLDLSISITTVFIFISVSMTISPMHRFFFLRKIQKPRERHSSYGKGSGVI